MAENKEQDNNTVIPGTDEVVNSGDGVNNSSSTVNNSECTGNDKGSKGNGKYNGTKNLRPYNQLTEEEQKELTSKGGKASVEARRRKRDMREIMQAILNADMTAEQIDEVLGSSKNLLPDGDMSAMAVLCTKMVQETAKGNYKAFESVRDTAGFKPEKNINLDAGISEADKELLEKVAKRLENKG